MARDTARLSAGVIWVAGAEGAAHGGVGGQLLFPFGYPPRSGIATARPIPRGPSTLGPQGPHQLRLCLTAWPEGARSCLSWASGSRLAGVERLATTCLLPIEKCLLILFVPFETELVVFLLLHCSSLYFLWTNLLSGKRGANIFPTLWAGFSPLGTILSGTQVFNFDKVPFISSFGLLVSCVRVHCQLHGCGDSPLCFLRSFSSYTWPFGRSHWCPCFTSDKSLALLWRLWVSRCPGSLCCWRHCPLQAERSGRSGQKPMDQGHTGVWTPGFIPPLSLLPPGPQSQCLCSLRSDLDVGKCKSSTSVLLQDFGLLGVPGNFICILESAGPGPGRRQRRVS